MLTVYLVGEGSLVSTAVSELVHQLLGSFPSHYRSVGISDACHYIWLFMWVLGVKLGSSGLHSVLVKVSVAVIIYYDQKQLGGESVYFLLQLVVC